MPKVINLPTATSMDDSDYLIMEESGGGTKKITRENALSHIGTSVGVISSLSSLPTGVDTDLCQLTLTKGIWVVVAQMRLDRSGETFQSYLGISTTSSSPQVGGGGFAQLPCVPPITSIGFNISRIINVTSSSQTVYLVGWHNASSAKSLSSTQTLMNAIRIA